MTKVTLSGPLEIVAAGLPSHAWLALTLELSGALFRASAWTSC